MGTSDIENGLRGAQQSPQTSTEEDEVVLVAQIIAAKSNKFVQIFSLLLVLVSLMAFGFSLTFKLTPQKILFRKPVVQSVNIGFGSLNVTLLGALILIYLINIRRIHIAKLTWSRRTRTISFVALAQLIVQFVNSAFFLFPNLHSKEKRCSWFERIQFICGTVRWTCWNSLFLLMAIHTHNICPWLDKQGNFRRGVTQKESADIVPLIIMDGAAWVHLPKIVFWAVFEFCIIFLATDKNYDYRIVAKPGTDWNVACIYRTYECVPGTRYRVLTSLWVFFIIFYVLMIQTYIMQARRRLLLGRYNEFLQVHLMVLIQRKQVWYVTIIGVVIVPVLWYTRWDRCGNYFVAWLGMLPLQVIASAITFINAYYFMPVPPGRTVIRQKWLQQFAWNESGYQEAKQQRSEGHPREVAEQLMKEPLFCFETAVKLALWSEVVYTFGLDGPSAKDTKEPASAKHWPCFLCWTQTSKDLPTSSSESIAVEMAEGSASRNSTASCKSAASSTQLKDLTEEGMMKNAMEMYDLEQYEIMAEDQLQTRALLGWSGSNLVVAFRGTATMANVVSDAKAWRSPHPPARGTWILGRQPLVHQGFLQTWTANGFNHRVIQRIKAIHDARTVPEDQFHIRFTGHSLGGAVAALAAMELQMSYRMRNVFVYTYGCPRTGNHAFCRELDALVPEHWQLINDRDAVPRNGKFYVLYKRAGQRTLLNQVGDIRVRPSVLELTIHRTGYSIKQHLMASYVSSLFSVCMAQCMQFKCEPGGRKGVEQLAQSPQIQLYFATTGLDLRGAVAGDRDVIVPSLRRKQSALSFCTGDLLGSIFSVLENMVPGLEEGGGFEALLSGKTAQGVAKAAVDEDDQQAAPEQLQNRIATLRSNLEPTTRARLQRPAGTAATIT